MKLSCAMPILGLSTCIKLHYIEKNVITFRKEKIIEEVNEPRDGAHHLVIVEKKDKTLRICLNPQDLNKYLKKEQYLIPTIEDVTIKLQLNRKYCSFNTPFGIYQFIRMPFGVS